MKFFQELKQNIKDILVNIKFILSFLHRVEDVLYRVEKQQEPPLLTVARHTLGSVDLRDISDPDGIDEKDYTEYTARAVQFYDFFEKEAKWMMKLQHDWWFTNSDSWEQTMFGRGTINGIQLLLDRFGKLKNDYTERTKKEPEPSIGSRDDLLKKLQVEGSDDLAKEMAENK